MYDVGDGWGVETLAKSEDCFCRFCQESLSTLPNLVPRCTSCGRVFDPADPSTVLPQRVFRPMVFWAPLALGAFVLSLISAVIAGLGGLGAFVYFAFLPAPLGMHAGYLNRTWLLCIYSAAIGLSLGIMVLVAGGFPAAMAAILSGAFATIPVGLGFLLGFILRTQLQQSRWSQRWSFRR